jgi:hypothetical protein
MTLVTTRACLRSAHLGLLLLTLALTGCGDQVVVEGINMDTDRPIGGDVAEVEDLGDGSTNDGGTPDFEADLHEAAITDEKNLGPNAPGYIP